MSKERELLERVLTSELWSVQEELQAEIKELLAQPEQEEQQPVATKLESHPFNAFHVSSGDFKELQKLPIGTKLYSEPPITSREMYQRGYAAAERYLKREPLSIDWTEAPKNTATAKVALFWVSEDNLMLGRKDLASIEKPVNGADGD